MKKGIQRKGIFLGLTLLIVALMLVIACSNAATTPAQTTAPTSAPITTATTTKAPTTSAPTTQAPTTVTPKTGGILKYGLNQDFPQIGDPPTVQVVRQPGIYDICLEDLFLLNRAGEVIPWLATGYQYDAAGTTLTLTLRKGVKFHDGTDFNATAVKWNLDKGKQFDQAKLASVKTIDVIDDYTVRLNLSKPDTHPFSLGQYLYSDLKPIEHIKGRLTRQTIELNTCLDLDVNAVEWCIDREGRPWMIDAFNEVPEINKEALPRAYYDWMVQKLVECIKDKLDSNQTNKTVFLRPKELNNAVFRLYPHPT